MAAGGGKLHIATVDGRLLCLGKTAGGNDLPLVTVQGNSEAE